MEENSWQREGFGKSRNLSEPEEIKRMRLFQYLWVFHSVLFRSALIAIVQESLKRAANTTA